MVIRSSQLDEILHGNSFSLLKKLCIVHFGIGVDLYSFYTLTFYTYTLTWYVPLLVETAIPPCIWMNQTYYRTGETCIMYEITIFQCWGPKACPGMPPPFGESLNHLTMKQALIESCLQNRKGKPGQTDECFRRVKKIRGELWPRWCWSLSA